MALSQKSLLLHARELVSEITSGREDPREAIEAFLAFLLDDGDHLVDDLAGPLWEIFDDLDLFEPDPRERRGESFYYGPEKLKKVVEDAIGGIDELLAGLEEE